MITPHKTPARSPAPRPTATPWTRGPQPGDNDLAEISEPYDPPFLDERWPSDRPAYLIVIDQLRGWQPGQPPSLAELLEPGRPRAREPEPDPEAEP